MYQYAQDLTPEGIRLIREFIRNGGRYLGICGGASLAADTILWKGRPLSMTSLALFSGTSQGPLPNIALFPDYTMCAVICADPWTSGSNPVWMLYYGGPGFNIQEVTSVDVLGRYEQGNLPAVLSLPLGRAMFFPSEHIQKLKKTVTGMGFHLAMNLRIEEQTGNS